MSLIEQFNFYKEVSAFTSRDDYANWIWTRIREECLPATGTINQEFQAYLRQAKIWSALQGLENLYDNLADEDKKLLFRQSIGDALLSHSDEEDTPREAIEGLIYLMGATRAVESIETLIPTLGHGSLGKRHGEYLLYSTIVNLEFLAPTPPTKEVTLNLITCPYFDEGYLLLATSVLIKCDPAQAETFLASFNPRITNFREMTASLNQKEQKAYRDSALRFKNRVLRYAPTANQDTIDRTIFG